MTLYQAYKYNYFRIWTNKKFALYPGWPYIRRPYNRVALYSVFVTVMLSQPSFLYLSPPQITALCQPMTTTDPVSF